VPQLDGVTVLDHSSVGPGARCTALLADLGADVVKVWPPPGKAIEPPFFAYGAGRGTRRERIDLRTDDGRDAFLRMTADADVVVESFRPGVADRLGVGYGALKKVNERIVYAALTGYGQDGPYAHWAGHDINYLAVGGFLATQGTRADGGPAIPGATIADSAGGGMQAALAIVAALYERTVTGTGRYLDISTTEGVLSLTSLNIDQFLATGEEPGPGITLLTGAFACYDVYPARDGRWIAVGAIENKFFANLCRALGREDLAPHQMDLARQPEIREAFRAAFTTKDRDDWIAELAPQDTCVAPVLSIAEVTRDPHLQARGVFQDVEDPEHGSFRVVGPVIAGTK
jgi:alpha-methylacyl-CoA racemase